jgi:hypothetical protein
VDPRSTRRAAADASLAAVETVRDRDADGRLLRAMFELFTKVGANVRKACVSTISSTTKLTRTPAWDADAMDYAAGIVAAGIGVGCGVVCVVGVMELGKFCGVYDRVSPPPGVFLRGNGNGGVIDWTAARYS